MRSGASGAGCLDASFAVSAMRARECRWYSALSIIAPSVNVLRRTRRKPSTIRGEALHRMSLSNNLRRSRGSASTGAGGAARSYHFYGAYQRFNSNQKQRPAHSRSLKNRRIASIDASRIVSCPLSHLSTVDRDTPSSREIRAFFHFDLSANLLKRSRTSAFSRSLRSFWVPSIVLSLE